MFQFHNDFPQEFRTDSLNLVMGNTPKSKTDFLAFLGEKLAFPDWWGRNWDAFEELISDSSRFRPKTVRLVFPTIPLDDPNELGTFLDILRHAQDALKKDGVTLEVLFTERDRAIIERS